MGRKALMERNKKRIASVALYRERRSAILELVRDKNASYSLRLLAYKKLKRLPRDSAPCRIRRLCCSSSRSRSVYGDFGVSRIVLRSLALCGMMPGVFKGSL